MGSLPARSRLSFRVNVNPVSGARPTEGVLLSDHMHVRLVQRGAESSKSGRGCMNDAISGVNHCREFNSGLFNYFRGLLVKRGIIWTLNLVYNPHI